MVFIGLSNVPSNKSLAGGNDQGDSLTELYEPQGVIVDQFHQIYVADSGNDRIQKFKID